MDADVIASRSQQESKLEIELRKMMQITADATLEDVLAMIREEGYEPHMGSRPDEEFGQLYACDVVRRGAIPWHIVQTVGPAGMMGLVGRLSPMVAAMDGLRRAKKPDEPDVD